MSLPRVETIAAEDIGIDITDSMLPIIPEPALETVETPVIINSKKVNDGYTQTLTKSMGVYYYNGKRETYYSSRALYHYRTAEWELDDNGFYHTTEGYFVVASNDYSQGTIIDISMGQAIVLDCGCASGTVDIYVNW